MGITFTFPDPSTPTVVSFPDTCGVLAVTDPDPIAQLDAVSFPDPIVCAGVTINQPPPPPPKQYWRHDGAISYNGGHTYGNGT